MDGIYINTQNTKGVGWRSVWRLPVHSPALKAQPPGSLHSSGGRQGQGVCQRKRKRNPHDSLLRSASTGAVPDDGTPFRICSDGATAPLTGSTEPPPLLPNQQAMPDNAVSQCVL